MSGRLRIMVAVIALLALAIAGAIARGMANALAPPIRRSVTIALADWPAGTAPMRVALLSDIHLGARAMRRERLDAIVDAVNASDPDLVLLAGDYVNGHDPSGATAKAAALTAPLERLRARYGVLAVLGNHDHWTGPHAIAAALSAAGITVLRNQAVRRGAVTILGIDDGYSGHDAIGSTVEGARRLNGPHIALTHSPDLAPRLPAGIPLLLAGHTHCGQAVLPWWGPLVTHAILERGKRLYDPRYRCGIVRDPGRTVIVTAGVGSGTSPLRYGAPPDWWLLTLTGRR